MGRTLLFIQLATLQWILSPVYNLTSHIINYWYFFLYATMGTVIFTCITNLVENFVDVVVNFFFQLNLVFLCFCVC